MQPYNVILYRAILLLINSNTCHARCLDGAGIGRSPWSLQSDASRRSHCYYLDCWRC